MRAPVYYAVLFASIPIIGCTQPVDSDRLDVRTIMPSATPLAPFTTCEVTTYRQPAASASHVDPCMPGYTPANMPPTGGDHFGRWAEFGIYDAPVPWGYLVHSMEHGAVVLGYNCPDGCDEVVTELTRIVNAQTDPLCDRADVTSRMILVPVPDLDYAVVALAWEHAYVATCLDSPSIEAFVAAHYGNATENLCVPGVNDAATGWCG